MGRVVDNICEEGCFQNQAPASRSSKLRVVGLSQSGGAEGQREMGELSVAM